MRYSIRHKERGTMFVDPETVTHTHNTGNETNRFLTGEFITHLILPKYRVGQ